jgi:iron complex transport system permease protein
LIRPPVAASILALVTGLLLVVAVVAGRTPADPAASLRALSATVAGQAGPLDERVGSIVLGIRLPRVLLGAFSGAGLAVSGLALQAITRNPLAEPYLIGVSSGASAGAVLAIGTGLAGALPAALILSAFAGGGSAALLVMAIAGRAGAAQPTRLVLAGAAVATLGTALTAGALYVSGERGSAIVGWLLGSLNGAGWHAVLIVAPAVLAVVAVVTVLGPAFDVLGLGDERARALGVRTDLLGLVGLGCAALATSVIVAVAGPIGFVGLVVPHLVRTATSIHHRALAVNCAIAGAAFLVVADLLARQALPGESLPVSVITAGVGAIVLAWVARSRGLAAR